MKVGIYTLGCKVNLYESECVISLLKEHGYEIASFEDVCDVYIINTCTVTNTSDVKSRKMIRSAIRRNPDACIVAMGCFIEANHQYHEDGLDIVLGNKDKSKIVSLLDEFFKERREIRRIYEEDYVQFEDMNVQAFEGRTRAFVKIQDGCENFCSYCIIPYVRGKCRSKKKEDVLSEVRTLVQNGYKEVVLTGIHTGNYGVDLDTTFADLLKELVRIKGLVRLRISSIEITELTSDVLAVLEESPIIVDHLHIPLQAGSDVVLKQMNRKYDLAYFRDKLMAIRCIRPHISITTDIIVGFPGERDEDFEETLATARSFAFSKIHVFPYSVRTGTKAASMDDQIDPVVKKERSRRLLALSKELEMEYSNKFIGKKLDVLIERSEDSFSYGHTSNYLLVKVEGVFPSGRMVRVLLTDSNYPYLLGKEIDSSRQNSHTLV